MKISSMLSGLLFLGVTMVYSQKPTTSFKALYEKSFSVQLTASDTLICGPQTTTDLAKMLAKENWEVSDLVAIDCLIQKASNGNNQALQGFYFYIGGLAYNDFDDEISEQLFQKAYLNFNKKNDWEGMFFSLTQLFNAKANIANASDEVGAREIQKLFDELLQVAKKTDYEIIDLSLKESQLRKAFQLNEKLSVAGLDSIANFALKYATSRPNRTRQLFTVLGIAYQKIGENEKALRFKRKALRLADPKKRDYPSYFANIGGYYISTFEYDSAKYYFSKAYRLIPQETDAIYLLDIKSSIAYNASVTYKTLKEMDSAWYYSINSLQAKYKLTNLQVAQNSSYADKKFEVKKRELELITKNIEIKNKKKVQIYLIVGLCVFAILLSILFFYYQQTKKLKAEAEELTKKREALVQLLNHDLRSPLQVFVNTATLLPKLIAKKRFDEIQVVQESLSETIVALQNTLNSLFNWDKAINKPSGATHKKEKNLSKEIESIVAVYEGFGNNRNIAIQSHITENITGFVFFTAFTNLVRNVVYNAVKHGNSDSIVAVKFIKIDEHSLCFSVQNTFSDANLAKIEMLKTAYASKVIHKNATEGLGINLILDAAEKLNGSITTELNEDVLTVRFIFLNRY